MIGWIYEINWLLIVMLMIGVPIGTEFGRRRVEAEGGIYSFLPLRTHRLLGVATCFSGALVAESAKVAVKMPTAYHVWMLIFATAAAFILFAIFSGLEFKLAKRAVKAAQTGGKPGKG